MKKYIKYILILVVMVSFFSLKNISNADPINTQTLPNNITTPTTANNTTNQTPNGTCMANNTAYYNVTESYCNNFYKSTSWTNNNDKPKGTCVVGDANKGYVTKEGKWTAEDCAASGGKFIADYQYLAPLPDPNNNGKPLTTFNPADTRAFSNYLNLIIKTIIGLAAIMAVVMITIGGVEYMTSELISSKESGKDKITGAVFGLVLALGAYALLNTINPDLLKDNVDIQNVNVAIDINNVQISGASGQSFYGKPVNITDAISAAKNAQAKTGVDAALILAIFQQETSLGANTGGCHPNDANMNTNDLQILTQMANASSKDVNTLYVSCALKDTNGNPIGHGGAMGLTQILPSTWQEIGKTGNPKAILGHDPDPSNTQDALLMTALFLKQHANDPKTPAGAYFGNCVFGNVNYCDSIKAKQITMQKQIDAKN